MKGLRQILQDLSIEALREWAGTTIFNRGRKYLGRVSNLSHTQDFTLVARVSGTQRYVTSVRLEGGGEFEYLCSCPFEGWRPCKHVVAVLLAALEMIDKGEEIPLLDRLGCSLRLEQERIGFEWVKTWLRTNLPQAARIS